MNLDLTRPVPALLVPRLRWTEYLTHNGVYPSKYAADGRPVVPGHLYGVEATGVWFEPWTGGWEDDPTDVKELKGRQRHDWVLFIRWKYLRTVQVHRHSRTLEELLETLGPESSELLSLVPKQRHDDRADA